MSESFIPILKTSLLAVVKFNAASLPFTLVSIVATSEKIPLDASKVPKSKSAASYPAPPISTVVVGSTVVPLNSLNLLPSDASENNPKNLSVPSL